MKIGVVYPQTEFGNDPIAIRDYAQTAEGLGFSHILAYSHILGANPNRPGGWNGIYTYEDSFQEPLVLFSHMAALTKRLEFTTGIIILPQRQTALFAKQAATLDVLSSGRLRIGIGIGWNHVEYIALNQDFQNRGRRVEEQVEVLRRMWTEPLVKFTGRWHNIPDAGINPLPVQRPIPIWFGGHADAVLKRIAHIGDGWMPNYQDPVKSKPALDTFKKYLGESGRGIGEVGLEIRIPYGDGDPKNWQKAFEDWRAEGATHLSLNTMRQGFDKPAEHINAMQTFANSLGLQANEV